MKKILFCIAITSYFSVYSSNASTMPAQHPTMTGQIPVIFGQLDYQLLDRGLDLSHALVSAQSDRSKITTSSSGLPPELKDGGVENAISSILEQNLSEHNLRLALDQTRTELCELRRLYSELQAKNDSNIREIAGNETAISALIAQNSSLQGQNRSLRQKPRSQRQVDAIELRTNSEVGKLKEELDSLRQKHSDSVALVGSLLIDIVGYRETQRRMVLGELSQEQFRRNFELLQAEVLDLRSRNSALSREISLARITLQQRESFALRAQQELDAKNREIQNIRSQLATMQQILNQHQVPPLFESR